MLNDDPNMARLWLTCPRRLRPFYVAGAALLFSVSTIQLGAQSFEWAVQGGPAIALDANGNIIVGKIVRWAGNGLNFNDVVLQKISSKGTNIWERPMQVAKSNTVVTRVLSLAIDPAGFIYTASTALNTNNGNSGFLIQKLSPNGDPVWHRDLGAAYTVAISASGLYAGGSDGTLQKYTTGGASLWNVAIPGTINAVAICPNEDVCVTGSVSGSTKLGNIVIDASQIGDTFVGRLSSSGTWIWAKFFHSPYLFGRSEGYGIAPDPTGSVLATGLSYLSNGGGPAEVFVVKYGPDGESIWKASFPGDFYNAGYSILAAANGEAFVTGSYGGPQNKFGDFSVVGGGYQDLFLAKLSANGQLLWLQTIATSENELGLTLAGNKEALYISGSYYATNFYLGTQHLTRFSPENIGSSFLAKRLYVAPPAIFGVTNTQFVASPGKTFSFDAAPLIDSSWPTYYSWSLDGERLLGQTNATLRLNSVKPSDSGLYRLTIANADGTNESLTISVGVPPVITIQPADTIVNAGHDAIFQVEAEGATGVQWRLNEAAITGATRKSLVLTNAGPGDAGIYSALVSNAWGSATSRAARLSVMVPPVITEQPRSQTVLVGETATFSVSASGAINYQWRFNGSELTGGTGAVLTLKDVAVAHAGNYDVAVSNSAGRVTSSNAVLMVNVPPEITTQPESRSVQIGDVVSLSVIANGATGYQWYKDGAALSGETNSTLTIVSAIVENEGDYSVVVNGFGATISSRVVRLAVNSPLVINVTTIAGNGVAGYLDSSNALEGRLNAPDGPSIGSDGVTYFADTYGNVIRYLTPDGVVGTLAGAGRVGYLDAPGTNAYFSFPIGTRALRNGDILVADAENDVIRRIVGVGLHAVSTLAGDGARGYVNGPAASARFAFPNDIAESASGNLYISEFDNNVIRKVASDGTVSTLAGDGLAGYADGRGTAAQFDHPGGLTLGQDGSVYVTEFFGDRIRKVTPDGVVTTVAGSGVAGLKNGAAMEAQFNHPNGIVADSAGNLYVSETANHVIRLVRPNGSVSTVAGLGRAGFAEGDETQALFNGPSGIAIAADGSLIVADTGNNRIRKIKLGPVERPTPFLLAQMVPSLTILGDRGRTYRIEFTENAGRNWMPLTNLTLRSSVETWVDPRPALGSRVYRAVLVTP